jgi:hypothetical protein
VFGLMLLSGLTLMGVVDLINPCQTLAADRGTSGTLKNVPLKKGMSYEAARALILKAGWQPNRDGAKNLRDRRVKSLFDDGYTEIEDCSGTGPLSMEFHKCPR